MSALSQIKSLLFISFFIAASPATYAAAIESASSPDKPEFETAVTALKVDKPDAAIIIPKITLASQISESDNNTTQTVNKKTSKPSLFLPYISSAKNNYIPTLSDAIIFANYDEDLPAIINYYTFASEDEVIAFYRDAFGEPQTQSRSRGRLTLSYLNDQQLIKVIISAQDNKHQVDVIVTSTLSTQ